MDLASRLASEVVRGASVGLCTGDGPFDLPPGEEFANRFLGTLQDQGEVELLRNAVGGPTRSGGSRTDFFSCLGALADQRDDGGAEGENVAMGGDGADGHIGQPRGCFWPG